MIKKWIFNAAVFCILFTGCYQQYADTGIEKPASLYDVPGITADEIAAIEELQKRAVPITYASSRTTELFETADGTLGGYTVLFCEWLSELFGIEFRPEIQGLGEMLVNLRSGELDFATLSDTPERRQNYFVTSPIAQRSVIMLRAEGSQPINLIRRSRLPRYVFTQGSVMLNTIGEVLEEGSYEIVMVQSEEDIYRVLTDGTADAFIATNNMEAAFDHLGGIYSEEFLPIIFLPAAMITANPEYEPVISIVTKLIESGAYEKLKEMYRKGYEDYRRHKLFMQLTDEERSWIRENPVIPFATHYMAYPISFFNKENGMWEGMVFDILDELEKLTDLDFKLINEPNLEPFDLMQLLEKGEAYFMPYLIYSDERRERFLWAQTSYWEDRFALLSKQSYPNIEVNDIPFEKVGLPRGTAFADMFRQWFPNAIYATEYYSSDEAFHAMDRGEINLVMSSQSRLAGLTNYYELSDYKANFLFNSTFDVAPAFNIEKAILRSIIDKAIPLIDTQRIAEQWVTKTYSIETMRLRRQRPWLIRAVALTLFMFTLLFAMYIKIYKNRKTISRQSEELSALLEKTKHVSDYELMKHTLTIKAMNVALWDAESTGIIPAGKNPFDQNIPVKFSDEFRKMLEFTDENDFPDFVSSWVNCLHPADKKRAMNDLLKHLNDLSGSTPYESEFRMKTKNGDYRHFVAFGETFRDKKGIPLRMSGAIKDITDRRQMALDLEQNQEMLAEVNKLLAEANKLKQISINSMENILNSLGINIYVTVPETGELLFVNSVMKKLFGREDDNLTGQYCYKVFRGFDRMCDFCPCFKLKENPEQAVIWEENIENMNSIFLHSDSLIDWPTGEKVHLQSAMDITELTRRKMEEERLRNESEAKSQFLANMSHEIRTPMNSIIGFSELAHNNENPPKTEEYLNKIHESAKLLLVIINDVLDISKIEAGKMELEKIPFDLNDIFSYCQSSIIKKANEKRIELRFNTGCVPDKKILGDSVRLCQVLLNLLTNAVKFTNSGTIDVLASASDSDDKHVTINFEIKDTGIGMTKAQITKIFEPFVQADTSITRKYGGTGLGLSITKSIIEMMGGNLNVDSTPGEGSSFSFILNFEYASEADGNNNLYLFSTDNEMPVFDEEILVCEDNAMNQQVISDHLERLGIKSVIAENGEEGIKEIKKRLDSNETMFSLILMDIHMPVMDGLEAAEKIKEMGVETPIVSMTANIMESELKLYKEKGMHDKLGKPFTSQELINLLKKYFVPVSYKPADKEKETAENEKMLAALRLNFYKSNQNIYADIIKALDNEDYKLAHRMAHTLKGTSGQIGEKKLQEAAAEVESMLTEPDASVKDKLGFLENELKQVLEKLSPLVSETEVSKKTLSRQEIKELFIKLEPMLMNSNPECMYLLDDLQSIDECRELIQYIDDFEFKEAADELNRIKRKLEID